jgi:hypothetical protein
LENYYRKIELSHTILLWFEFEMSPTCPYAEYLVPRLWCYFGRLWKLEVGLLAEGSKSLGFAFEDYTWSLVSCFLLCFLSAMR